MKKISTLILFLGVLLCLKAQDTLTVVAYNTLKYPSSDANKADTLKPIIKYLQPDIFMVCELTSSTGATTILNDAMNVDGVSYYQKASYMNGPDTENMIYYNSEKLTLKSQQEIATVLRNISEYVLYYDNGSLTAGADTAFIHVYVAHLKAGNSADNAAQRNQEVVALKNYLDGKIATLENVILGGDFNIYGSSEAAYSTLLSGGSVNLNDPINTPGEWHNDYNYRFIHTQSTRTTFLGDGGATGGMDDRFDFLLVGDDVMNGSNAISYVDGSYEAVGNDGQHFNGSLIGAPTNNSVPSNVLNALYYFSDHLPVAMKIAYDGNVGVTEYVDIERWNGYLSGTNFYFNAEENNNMLTAAVIDVVGKQVLMKKMINTKEFKLDLSDLNSGLYFVKVNTPKQYKTFKVIKR